MLNPMFSSSDKVSKLLTRFKSQRFSIKDSNITYRTLNHYQEQGVLSNTKDTKLSWRKLSAFELIWIEIIIRLREIGVSLKNVKALKEFLFSKSRYGTIDKAEFINYSFEQEVALSLVNKYDLYLVIFSDFTCTFHDSNTISQWYQKEYKNEVHINIPLKPIIKQINGLVMD